MQEVFLKIIELLTQKENEAVLKAPNTGDIANAEYQKWMMKSYGFKEAIEIVKQTAEECKTGHFCCNSNGQHEKCSACCDYVCKNRNREWFGEKGDNNGWIPCSSGVMPRANGWYLVTNHLGVVQEQRWSANHWEKLRDDAVLAWRELPSPYQPGDILYVRETWRVGAWDIRNQMIAFDYKDGTCRELTYIHDRKLFERLVNQSREDARKAKCEYNGVDFIWEKGKSPCRWRPSIHMPKEAARIWLKVKDVRVERLQEMDCKDAMKEGIDPRLCINLNHTVVKFQKLWNSTIKKSDIDRYGWDANSWVWVIEFERCEKPE